MSERLGLASARDEPFRPPASGNRMLVLVALATSALLCLAVSQDWLTFGRGESRLPPQSTAARSVFPPVRLPEIGAEPAPLPADAPRIAQITKCVGKSAAAAYVDGGCPAGTRAVAVSVQPDLNLADGMSPGARRASVVENSVAAQQIAAYQRQVASRIAAAGDVGPGECAQIEAQIRAVDDAARRPNVASEQDRLANERRSLSDRQFRLRCR